MRLEKAVTILYPVRMPIRRCYSPSAIVRITENVRCSDSWILSNVVQRLRSDAQVSEPYTTLLYSE